MSLSLENVRVSYGGVLALDGVSLQLEPGEMFFLLGPSGCGKSTLLRSVAGFIEDFEGEIRIGGESLKGIPAHRRDFGMVFQNYALFPHLTVQENVSFGLEARKTPVGEVKERVAGALKMVGLTGFEARRPGELSGGQQQRVALARAVVIKPRVLLLDEPLSNLDAQLRWEMRGELKRIHQATQLTTLYVTHDQKEALSLAGRMAILKSGKVEALGKPRDLYWDPPTFFSAAFLGDINSMDGTLEAAGSGWKVKSALGEIPVELNASNTAKAKQGQQVVVFTRPESITLLADNESAPAGYTTLPQTVRITGSAFLGTHTLYELEVPGGLHWRALRHESIADGLTDGSSVRIAAPLAAWRVIG